MTKHMAIFVVAVVIVAALLMSTVMCQVDEVKDIVVIKRFGKIVKVMQGPQQAGLHFKLPWPIESVTRYDSRLQVLRDAQEKIQTTDGSQVMVNLYCTWGIGNVEQFNVYPRTMETADDAIATQMQAVKAEVLPKYALANLVNIDPKAMKLAEVEQKILDVLAPRVRSLYGVEVKQVGVQVLALDKETTQAVIASQKAEREAVAERYRSAGDADKSAIVSRADSAAKQILAFAGRKASDIRTEGQRDAQQYYAVFAQNEKLAIFLRDLESLKSALASRSVIVLDKTVLPSIGLFTGEYKLDRPTPAERANAATQPSQALVQPPQPLQPRKSGSSLEMPGMGAMK